MAQSFHSGVSIVVSGFSASTGAASAASPIPVDSSGRIPSYVRVTARSECYIKLGLAGVTATTNDILVQPADSLYLQIPKGLTHVAYIQGPTAGQVSFAPLENS